MEGIGRDIAGRFAKGHPGFKKPGTEFQRTTRQRLGEFLESKLEELDAIYEELPARDKARLLLSISEFFLPKQREHFVEIDEASVNAERLNLTRLSPEALNEILELAANG